MYSLSRDVECLVLSVTIGGRTARQFKEKEEHSGSADETNFRLKLGIYGYMQMSAIQGYHLSRYLAKYL
jgi:hypothetical protein